MKNILEWLEGSEQNNPEKVAFTDADNEITFNQTVDKAQRIGTYIADSFSNKKAVAVFIDKSCACVVAMMGAVYAGCFYVVIDVHSPEDRIKCILDTLDNSVIIADKESFDLATRMSNKEIEIISYESAISSDINHAKLDEIRGNMIDQDPAYILFTSGSTGKPKGTVVSHRALISYVNWVSNEFKFGTNTSFGSQAPLYFSMSVTDLYSTIKCGSTFHIIPRQLFMFPLDLIEYLNKKKVNTIYWVPTAISILSNWKAFDVMKPEHLKTVLFAGEVMPTKQLNYWIRNLDKDVVFANLFGPTETTDICTFYVVNREFRDDENLPIGKHCDNCNVFIIKEDGTEAGIGEEGELYARGSFLADGYYDNPEKTAEAFVQNPLNKMYPEKAYKTGDLVKYNELGEILYISRKDFQIKRNGYRIELGEIEAGANSVDKVKGCVCVYNKDIDCLALFYEGGPKDSSKIRDVLTTKVPAYMMPDKFVRLSELPKNANGKIDRKKLMNELKNIND